MDYGVYAKDLQSLSAWLKDLTAQHFHTLPAEIQKAYHIAQKRHATNPWLDVAHAFYQCPPANIMLFLIEAGYKIQAALDEIDAEQNPPPRPDLTLVRRKRRGGDD